MLKHTPDRVADRLVDLAAAHAWSVNASLREFMLPVLVALRRRPRSR